MKLKTSVLLASLFLGLICGLTSLSNPGYRLETVALDSWFSIRYSLFGKRQVDPSVVLVGVDEATIQHFGKPQLLWQPEIAQIIQKIKLDQPKVVGLDIVISPAVHGLDEDDPLKSRLQQDALVLGLEALSDPPVVLGEAFSEGYISHGQTDKDDVISPDEVILEILKDENGNYPRLALVNSPLDPDGVTRRSKLYFRVDKSGSKTPSNFALRLLEFATGVPVEYENDSLRWKGRRVPMVFQNSFMLNFPGPTENPGEEVKPDQPLSFPTVSALDIIDNRIEEGFFKDKIVIVAPTSASLFDEKVVPGDPQYHGGAVHATVLNMFLTDSFITRSPALWIALCIVLSFAGWKMGRQSLLGPGVTVSLLLIVVPFAAFTWFGIWLPTISGLISYAGASFFGYLERLFTIERDRAKVRSTFARMVSPQVMNHVLANYQSLANGQRKELTVLFSDINNFTPICEKHDPEEVIQMLSEYFSLMVDVIMKYDGYLKQYVGDEIMVIFGAPDDSQDHATRAVLTALEMRDALARAKETSQGKPGFYEVKVGINTGSVVVGKVGPESRWEYAAVGDDVNLGARVMSAAQKLGMDIGVSGATKERYLKEMKENSSFTDKVKWESQGVQSFKGKTSQMEVFGIERE